MTSLTLTIMRHGDAEETSFKGDRHRILTRLGEKEVTQTALLLQRYGTPDRVLVSDAERVRRTSAIVCEILKPRSPPQIFPDLYLASMSTILGHLSRLDGKGDHRVLLIGHNPGISDISIQLTGEMVRLGTGEAIIMSIEAGDWREAVAMDGCWQRQH